MTDFANDELLGVEGVIAIPHLGASTPEAEDNCASMAAGELIDYLENGNIVNSVNMPAVSCHRTEGARICVIHKNNPGMINKLSALFSSKNINIENMLNKSKKDYAYTLIDVAEKEIDESIVDGIKNVEGTIRVRVIK